MIYAGLKIFLLPLIKLLTPEFVLIIEICNEGTPLVFLFPIVNVYYVVVVFFLCRPSSAAVSFAWASRKNYCLRSFFGGSGGTIVPEFMSELLWEAIPLHSPRRFRLFALISKYLQFVGETRHH